MPLWARQANGEMGRLDLDVDTRGGRFIPRNPLVKTSIGRELEDGVRFVSEGVSLRLEGATASPGSLVNGKLSWPEALEETGWIVAPTAFGVETFADLRSKRSPERLVLGVDMRDGDRLEAAAGGASVVRGGKVILRVGAPVAVDARGALVGVAMRVAGERLVVDVAHREAGVVHPVLVDPSVEGALVEESLSASASGWTHSTPFAARFSGSVKSGSFGTGQYQETTAPALFSDQEYGWWRYTAPRQSFVYRADFSSVTHTPASLAVPTLNPSCVTAGILNGAVWATTGGWTSASSSGSGAWSSCAAVVGDTKTHCALSGCAVGGAYGNSAAIKQWISGTGLRNNVGTLFMGSASVYLSDDNDPQLLNGSAPSQWYSGGVASWIADVRDAGLGAFALDWAVVGGPSGSLLQGCTGLQASRCPDQWTPTVAINTADLSQGANSVTVTARDAIDRDAVVISTIHVDRDAPEVGYSGTVNDFAGKTIGTPAALRVDARDGSETSLRSGVRSIRFLVDGIEKDVSQQACGAGSCAMSKTWVFDPSQYAPGEHEIRAVTRDGAGNEASQTFDVWVGTGRITSILDGHRTTRHVVLQARGTQNHSGLRFQYRKTAGGSWQDVPASTLRNSDGSALAGWPVALSGGEHGALTWDLVGSSGANGMVSGNFMRYDRSVQVRAVFAGGEAGASQEVWVTLDRFGTSARNDTASIGPGEVDLLTGNFAFTQTDVDIDAFKADLEVTRTYNSRKRSSGAGVLGEGWTLNVPHASGRYPRLTNLAEPGPPPPPPAEPPEEWECDLDPEVCEEDEPLEPPGLQPYVIVYGPDEEEVTFTEKGDGYEPEKGYETLRLTRVMSTTQLGKIARFELLDSDSGEQVVYTPSGAGSYRMSDVRVTGAGNGSATFVYESSTAAGDPPGLHLRKMIAATAPGVSCATTIGRGCRFLEFVYGAQGDGYGSSGKLAHIRYLAWDPATAAMKTTLVTRYKYENGRLYHVDDPSKTGSSHEWQFEYDSARRLSRIIPTFLASWDLTYAPSATDPSSKDTRPATTTPATGRLRTVQRWDAVLQQSQTSTVVYDVPLSGAAAPHDMSAAAVAAWGQTRTPVAATAIFRPDDVPASPPSSYAKATIHYLDAYGREVNVASPGGHISTSERDPHGNAVRELTAANRARALAASGDPAGQAAFADRVATNRTYSGDGVRLLEELGPEHDIRLVNGTTARARRHATFTYDQGAPATGGPYNLPTTETVGARVAGEILDRDTRTTTTAYDWALREPTQRAVDPAGLNLRTVTVYDAQTGQATERRMPRNPSGGDASATKTVYWTAGSNAADSGCGNRPEWAGLECATGPVAQPATSGLPDLPVSKTEYAYRGLPAKTTDTVSGTQRETAYSYDDAGRLVEEQISGGQGTALGKIAYEYKADGFGPISKHRIYDGNDSYDVSRSFDTHGRTTSTTTSQIVGGVSTIGFVATRTFDLLDRVKTQAFENHTQTYTYDATRGLLTQLTDPHIGTILGEYDHDGQLTKETFNAVALAASTTYDETGAATRRVYEKTGCSSNCVWQDSSALESIHGQWLSHGGTQSDQEFSYDAAGRLTETRDDVAGQGCEMRSYGFDADSNRTSLTSYPPAAGGACSTANGQNTSNSYDAADRLTTSGITYDSFGRITEVPASHAGDHQLTAEYFVNDRVRKLTQGPRSVTLELDALLRPRQRKENNTQTEHLRYADDSDRVVQTTRGNETVRYIPGLTGDFVASTRTVLSQSTTHLQLSNLHGDIVGEAPATTGATGPSKTWETDEYGIPRDPVRAPAIKAVSPATSTVLPTGGNSITIARPANVQAGTLLVAGVAASPASTISKPAGWEAVGNFSSGQPDSADSSYRAFWRIATANEPASYTFPVMASQIRGGMIGLANAHPTAPIDLWNSTAGANGNATIAAIQPNYDETAIVAIVGNDSGDTDTGGAWNFPAGSDELFDLTTGTTTSHRSLAMAVRPIVNGKSVIQGPDTATNDTGNPNAGWGTITINIRPAPPATQQYRYRYLGSKSRPLELPGGATAMGARVYLPQLGRFLQTDPIPGASANAYDYANQDPINQIDLDGLMPMRGNLHGRYRPVRGADLAPPPGRPGRSAAAGEKLKAAWGRLRERLRKPCATGAAALCALVPGVGQSAEPKPVPRGDGHHETRPPPPRAGGGPPPRRIKRITIRIKRR